MTSAIPTHFNSIFFSITEQKKCTSRKLLWRDLLSFFIYSECSLMISTLA